MKMKPIVTRAKSPGSQSNAAIEDTIFSRISDMIGFTEDPPLFQKIGDSGDDGVFGFRAGETEVGWGQARAGWVHVGDEDGKVRDKGLDGGDVGQSDRVRCGNHDVAGVQQNVRNL